MREWKRFTRDQEFQNVVPAREAGVLLRGLARWWRRKAAVPKFSFVHLLTSHVPHPPSQIQLHDLTIKRGIEALLKSRNTVVVLMSDHGHRLDEIGYFLPYLKVMVPRKLLQVHPKLAKLVDVAIQNGDKMVSTLDLHHFLRGITLFQNTEVEKAGLLSHLMSDRSCTAVGAEPGHCLCDQSKMKFVDTLPETVVSVVTASFKRYRSRGCADIHVYKSSARTYSGSLVVVWIVKLHTTKNRLFEAYVHHHNNDAFEVVALKQLTSYAKDEKCAPAKTDPEFCICA